MSHTSLLPACGDRVARFDAGDERPMIGTVDYVIGDDCVIVRYESGAGLVRYRAKDLALVGEGHRRVDLAESVWRLYGASLYEVMAR